MVPAPRSASFLNLEEKGGGHQNETNLDPGLFLNDLRNGREVEFVLRGSGVAISYRDGD